MIPVGSVRIITPESGAAHALSSLDVRVQVMQQSGEWLDIPCVTKAVLTLEPDAVRLTLDVLPQDADLAGFLSEEMLRFLYPAPKRTLKKGG